jgi:hypothetical protein
MTGFRLLVLLAASHALLAGPALATQAISAGEPFVVTPMPADARAQVNPAVAYDGQGTYLVVWQQGRFYHETQSADIVAVRADFRGRVLDRQPIIVCNVGASQERPQVAFSGGAFLVVWHDLRNGRDWDVYAARVSPAGKVREPNGFLVAGGAQNQASPVLAPADDGFLVVWQHYDRHYRLQASMIPAAGPARPGQPLQFRDKTLWGGQLALARVGDGWLLAWNDEKAWSLSGGATGMTTRRFARLGLRNGKAEALEVRRAPAIALGRSGGQFASDGASSALYAGWGIAGRGNRVAVAALFDAGRALPLKNPNAEQARHWSGWNTERMITLYNVGVPVDGPVAVAYGQGGYLAAAQQAYSGKPSDRNRLLGSRLTAAGVRIDKAPAWPVLHDSPYRIANPALVGGSRQFLLAFEQEDAAGRRQIWAKLLRAE